jgi:hypothetical protein
MKRFLPLFMALFTVLNASSQNSQNKISLIEGTRYMVAFPMVQASPSEKPMPQPMQLYISSKVKTTVRVETPATINDNARINREYTIQANEVLKIPISTSYMNGISSSGPESQTRRGYGIYITSKKPISVSTYQAWMGNGELARHLPIDAWGKNYVTMNFYQDRYGTSSSGYKYRPSQILLVSAKDNTVVTYTPTAATEGGNDNPSTPSGVSQTITLDKGETYLIKSKIDENYNKEWITDLSGTIIKSNKPLGVISGHTKVAIMRYPDVLPPTGMFAAEAHFVRNNVHDAMLPVEMAGTKFVTIPCLYTPTRVVGQGSVEFGIDDDRGDVVRVVALEDNTKVFSMRQDGSGLKPERTLRKGESFLATSQEVATYWETDKPSLISHYGKSYAKILPPALRGNKGSLDAIQGHPTVESGMPMMQYVPSVDRWASYGVFTSPEGMDNFLNIVFTTDQVGKIKIDGRSLTSAFGGSTRPIKGTPYSFIRTPIGAGNHVIESESDKIRWAAWTYGSLDGLQQGRAYGTPIAIDLAIPCDDSLAIEDEIICGNVEGKVKLLPENSTCAKFFAFIVEDASNYDFEADIDNLTEYTVFPFKLKVLDKKLPAYAKIRIITRSGNWIEKEFKYEGIDLVFDPDEVNFGTHAIGDTVCAGIRVTNNSDVVLEINNMFFAKTEFSVTPSSITLQPRETKNIAICGTVVAPITVRDTLIATINCADISYIPVQIRGDEPVFYAGDQNWGTIPKSSTQTKQVELINAGKSDVIITDYQPRGNSYFTNTTLISSLPLTLKPGQRFKYDVDYSPNGETGVSHTLRIDYTVNAEKEKLYSELQGAGSDAQLSITPLTWTERVIDAYQVSKGITMYSGTVTIQNLGNVPSTIKSIEMIGPDANYFTVKTTPTTFNSIPAGKSEDVELIFTPTELSSRAAERNYTANMFIRYTVNGSERTAQTTYEGTALQPQVILTDQDWGSNRVNTKTTLPITISNISKFNSAPLTGNAGGTMELIIDSLQIEENTPFVWTQTNSKTIVFTPPMVINSSNTGIVNVDFIPTTSGSFIAKYRLYGNVLDTNFATLIGETPGESKINPLRLLSWYSIPTTGTVTGVISYPTLIRFKEFRGNDYLQFNVAPGETLNDISVEAGIPFTFNVEFTPDAVTIGGLKSGQNLNGRLPYRDTEFITEIVFEEVGTGNELSGYIIGDGKYLETTLRIVGDKKIDVGKTAKTSFFLEPRPESIDSGNVESARLRVIFDNNIITPELVKPSDFPTASLIDETISLGMIEIDLITPPQVDGFLGTREFQTLLYSKSVTKIDGLYYTINKGEKTASPYVVINVIPDDITVVPVCANSLRVVEFGSLYAMAVKNNIIEISVGIDAPLTLTSVNELGQQEVIFSGFVKKGIYHFPIQKKGLQWIVGTQGDWIESMGIFVQ